MTFPRHVSRSILAGVTAHIIEQLDSLGWRDPDDVPFNAMPVTVTQTSAFSSPGALAKDVTAGRVSITLGNEFHPVDEEMGGPLTSQDYPIFIDVFQDSDAAALCLATDIRDILLGRIGGKRSLTVTDYATSTPAVLDGWIIELDDVERVRPDHSLPLFWQVVKVTANAYFPEAVY